MNVPVVPDFAGGDAYQRRISQSDADSVVTTATDFVSAVENAGANEIVFVPGDTIIDLTGETNIATSSNGVVIASDRGINGSQGALIHSDDYSTDHPYALIKSYDDEIRVTGFRIQGPTTSYISSYDDTREAGGIWLLGSNTEIDNCEIYGWPGMALKLAAGGYSSSSGVIHHNDIHHCWMDGLGYGAEIYDGHYEFYHNYIDATRHPITGFGSDTCSYAAYYNVIGPEIHGHGMDMHAWEQNGGPSGDTAGESVDIQYNTFMFTEEVTGYPQEAVKIRGVPVQQSYIKNNWFRHPTSPTPPGSDGEAVLQEQVSGDWSSTLTVSNNAYGDTNEYAGTRGAPQPVSCDHLIPRVYSNA